MRTIPHITLWVATAFLLLLVSCHRDTARSKANGQDSLYTHRHIQSIAITQPERALALLDTAEAKGKLSSFDLNDLRNLVYHNGLSRYKTALHYARLAYADPEARRNPRRLMSLVAIMADECHTNGDYAGSITYCAEGLDLAKQLGNKTYEGNLNVTWGLNLLEMNQYEGAWQHIDRGIELLEEEVNEKSSYHSWDELFYALGMKLNLLWEKDKYHEAIAMRPQIEHALKGLENSGNAPQGLMEMRRAEIDAIYCLLAYSTGNRAQGDSLYRCVDQNPFASTSEGEYIRIHCLNMAGRYDEALHYILKEKQRLKQMTDTVNWDYINPHLESEMEAYRGKGNWRAVARVQQTMLALTDTLREREQDAQALELAEIYQSNEKTLQIERQAEKIRRHYLIFAFTAPVLALLVLYLVHIQRSKRLISRKNEAMVKTIDELMAYKEELFEKQDENLRLREEQKPSPTPPTEDKATPNEAGKAETYPAELKQTELSRTLYERINHHIIGNKLYLRPDFNEQELMKEFHISANQLAEMFKTFAGSTFMQYVNERRLDYAVQLMRAHPQWDLETIAQEARMPKKFFFQQFQKKYGLKPSQYREKNQPNKKIDE